MKVTQIFGVSRQLIFYLAFGVFQLCLDWLIFISLTHLGVDIRIANPTSRFIVALAGYLLNGLFTFRTSSTPQIRGKTLIKYLALWALLTCLSTLLILLGHRLSGDSALPYVKFIVEAFLALVSFTLMKLWVYR
jgi:putative flippase GtrA